MGARTIGCSIQSFSFLEISETDSERHSTAKNMPLSKGSNFVWSSWCAAMKSINKKEKTPGYFMTIKMLQFEKFQGKKDTTFRCSNRKGSKEISQAIFLLQNPAVCLYNSHSGKRVKGRYLRSF